MQCKQSFVLNKSKAILVFEELGVLPRDLCPVTGVKAIGLDIFMGMRTLSGSKEEEVPNATVQGDTLALWFQGKVITSSVDRNFAHRQPACVSTDDGVAVMVSFSWQLLCVFRPHKNVAARYQKTAQGEAVGHELKSDAVVR